MTVKIAIRCGYFARSVRRSVVETRPAVVANQSVFVSATDMMQRPIAVLAVLCGAAPLAMPRVGSEDLSGVSSKQFF
jgi:hypothetical protein